MGLLPLNSAMHLVAWKDDTASPTDDVTLARLTIPNDWNPNREVLVVRQHGGSASSGQGFSVEATPIEEADAIVEERIRTG